MTDMTEYPYVLIDAPEDGCIEDTAWVEVTSAVMDAAAAVKVIETEWPLEDREEEEHYVCEGQQEWLAPGYHDPCDECDGRGDSDCPGCEGSGTVPYEYLTWSKVDPQTLDPDRRATAKCFWVVKVVCKV